MTSTSVLRVLAIMAAGFVLGAWWGVFCDWLWPGVSGAMAVEVAGGSFFGLFVSLRTRRWWRRPSTTNRKWRLI